jgi:(E)-4-hydroxy-3-methyl-but-2-enyl pyrophosphate reductase
MERTIKRAEKYGFCSGVRIADLKVKRFAAAGGRGAVLGQLVHNERVVEEMERLGVGTVDEIAPELSVIRGPFSVPPAGDEARTTDHGQRTTDNGPRTTPPTIIFSAHGVPPSFHNRAREAGLQILDTTCKFVYDLHRESTDALGEGYHLVFIGDPRHREVIGYTHDLDPATYHIVSTVDEAASIDWSGYAKIKVFYQTTLNAEEFEEVVQTIERRAARVERADTICYATKQNQDAARLLARDPEVDLIVVIGGTRSANTKHLWEICRESKPSYLVQGPDDLDPDWFHDATVIGLTAGASTPDYVIDEVEARIAELLAELPLSPWERVARSAG